MLGSGLILLGGLLHLTLYRALLRVGSGKGKIPSSAPVDPRAVRNGEEKVEISKVDP